MKIITAIIKPHKLDDVREALTPLGVAGMTGFTLGDGLEHGRDVFIAFGVRRPSEIKITAICL